VRSLAMVAAIVHGAPFRFADPARFSFAHGGKDRHPFPVPITVYDQTIRVLKTAVAKARLGREEELAALKRLDDQARRLLVPVSAGLGSAVNPESPSHRDLWPFDQPHITEWQGMAPEPIHRKYPIRQRVAFGRVADKIGFLVWHLAPMLLAPNRARQTARQPASPRPP